MEHPFGDPPPRRLYDVNFELTDHGYEVWVSDRIANDHPDLVDQFGDWMEEEIGVINVGQVDDRAFLADGVLTDDLKARLLDWWATRVEGLIRE